MQKLTNTENGQVVNAPPDDTTPSSIDIPWAEDYDTFYDRHLTIKVGGTPKYYLFQSFGRVRYCTGTSATDYGRSKYVSGYYQGDGDRVLILRSDTFEIERA